MYKRNIYCSNKTNELIRKTLHQEIIYNIIFIIPDEKPIELLREHLSLQNTDKIFILRQEIQKDVWDNFLKTAIQGERRKKSINYFIL